MSGEVCVGGLACLEKSVAEFVWITTIIIAIYFFVGLVVNVSQAQLSSATGDRIGYSHALQQAIATAILLAISTAVYGLSDEISSLLTSALNGGNLGNDPAALVVFWQGIARLVVSLLVGGSVIVMSVGVVYSGLAAQTAQAAGLSNGVSQAVVKGGSMILGGLLTIMSTYLANLILDVAFN